MALQYSMSQTYSTVSHIKRFLVSHYKGIVINSFSKILKARSFYKDMTLLFKKNNFYMTELSGSAGAK